MSFKKKALTLVAATLVCCNFVTTAHASNYKIQQGDTLSGIAGKHNITVAELKKANNLTSDTIIAGKYLYIPDGGAYHTIVSGDTLSQLASRYHVSVNDIKKANNLKNDTIKVGDTLWIPLASAKNTALTSRSAGSGSYKVTANEMELMAKAVYGEARGESTLGQIAVAAVILNRLDSPEFPNTITEVIYEPWAFTCVNDGQINLTPNTQAYQAVKEALTGYDPTMGSTYYWNPLTATSPWIWSRAVVVQIGSHLFGY